MDNLIIFGTGKIGQMLYYLITESTQYNVVCFTAEKKYCLEKTLLSLPLVAFDDVVQKYPPSRYKMLTVLGGLGHTDSGRNVQ